MATRVSTHDVRQRIGDLLNRVSLRRDEFVIERKGKALAALVPVERLEQMKQFARKQGLEMMAAQRGTALSERDAEALALEAKRWARRPARKAHAGAK